VELHAHSAFSFLDGASSPAELAAAAARLGYPALALTDHDGVWGSMEFALACKGLGVRPVTGAELTLEGGAHLTLLVESRAGYRNLCRLLTAAHSHTREGPQRAAAQPWVGLDLVEEHAEGLVCLSGCAGAGALAGAWERGEAVAGEALARRLLRAFGRDRFRVELQRPYWRHDRARNRWLSALAERLGVPCAATGDVHSHDRRRARLQDAFVAVRLGRRWRPRSRAAAATRPRRSARRRRWPPASPSTRRPSPRPCASPSGSAST
jgi:error-prone DNA polymerase